MEDTNRYDTREHRLQLYRDAIEMIMNNPSLICGLCYVMRKFGVDVYALADDLHVKQVNEFEKKLPELYAQKPKNISGVGCYWWMPGEWQPRIEALERAIELIEKS
jgi:hypothetical protein